MTAVILLTPFPKKLYDQTFHYIVMPSMTISMEICKDLRPCSPI